MSSAAGRTLQQQQSPPRLPPAPSSDRALHGRVGLVNQGATCYLNSLLQVLFHLPYFRSAVYRCVGGSDAATSSASSSTSSSSSAIPAALQEVFFQLQECNHAPKTEGLTKSFGWSEAEVFEQHDIHELLTLLRDELEARMKGTPSQGAINRLFEGRIENVIATLDGSYVSRRPEAFFDIQLEVAGHKSLLASLTSLVKKEPLTGDNKYKVEEEGKPAVFKDAEKGLTYTRFPPVLCFHLQRFAMDLMSPNLDMRKVNDRFEFEPTLDLRGLEQGAANTNEGKGEAKAASGAAETKEGGADASSPPPFSPGEDFAAEVPAIYDLHSVIVHKGSVNHGHYYCYVREVRAIANSNNDNKKGADGEDTDEADTLPNGSTSADTMANASTASSRHVDPNNVIDIDGGNASAQQQQKQLKEKQHESITATTRAEDVDFADGGQWYELDDDYVTRVTDSEAVFGNFGGPRSNNSAYMLTYVRRGFWPSVMRPTPTDEIPQRAKDELRRVLHEADAARRAAAEEATRVYCHVVDDSHINEHVRRHGFDLIVPPGGSAAAASPSGNGAASSSHRGGEGLLEAVGASVPPGAADSSATASPRFHTLVARKDDNFSALYDLLQEKLGYSKGAVRLRSWDYHYDNNVSYRPAAAFPSFDECSGTIESVLVAAGLVPAPGTAQSQGTNSNGSPLTTSSAYGRRGAASAAAPAEKPYSFCIYVEQRRVGLVAPPPAASLGAVVPEGTLVADPPLDLVPLPLGGGKEGQQRQQSSSSKHSQNAAAAAATAMFDVAAATGYDGFYSMNLLAMPPSSSRFQQQQHIIADAAVSSSNASAAGATIADIIRAGKPLVFAARDQRPRVLVKLSCPRVLSAVALRFAVSKNAMRANYTVFLEAYATEADQRGNRYAYRFGPLMLSLPNANGVGARTFVLEPSAAASSGGPSAAAVAAASTPVQFFSIIASSNTPNTPNIHLTLQGLYADEVAEARLVLSSKRLQLRTLLAAEAGGEASAAGNKQQQRTAASVAEEAARRRSLAASIAYLESGSFSAAANAASIDGANTADAANAGPSPSLTAAPVLPRARPQQGLLLMLKGYTPTPANGEHLRFLGPLLVDAREPLAAYAEPILGMMGLPMDRMAPSERRRLSASLRFVEEQHPRALLPLHRLIPLSAHGLIEGNVIIVEMAPASTSSLCRLPSVLAFWDERRHRTPVSLRLRSDPQEPIAQMVMDLRWSYQQVCEAIAVRAASYFDATSSLEGPRGGGATPSPAGGPASTSTTPTSPLRERLLADVEEGGGGSSNDAPLFDADRIILYPALELYSTLPAPDPIVSTSRCGATLESILRANGGRHFATDLFFDLSRPGATRLEEEQCLFLRGVIADECGEVYTDTLSLALPRGAQPPDLVQAMFAAARAETKKRIASDAAAAAEADAALLRMAQESEAFCLVATEDNRIVGFWDNILLSNGAEGGSSSNGGEDDDDENNDDEDDEAKVPALTKALADRAAGGHYIPPAHSFNHMRRLAKLFSENTLPLDRDAFTQRTVYQLRPIALLADTRTHRRLYVGFCDCPRLQYHMSAPLFHTPMVITIGLSEPLDAVWARLAAEHPAAVKGARTELDMYEGDLRSIKFVMFTTNALYFKDWEKTPVSDYFRETQSKSRHQSMLCINKPRPKEAQRPRYGAEPKLRLGGGGGSGPNSGGGGTTV